MFIVLLLLLSLFFLPPSVTVMVVSSSFAHAQRLLGDGESRLEATFPALKQEERN